MNKRKSFTLLEILVAMAILGVVVATMYTSFRGGTSAWTAGDARSQRCQNARVTLEMITRDLKQAFTKSGTDYQFQGSDGIWAEGDNDSVYFTAVSNYPNDDNEDEHDLCEVRFYLDTDSRILYRGEDDVVDSDLTTGEQSAQLGMHVIGLDLRYHNGTIWSSDGNYPKSDTLPKAVEITIRVEDEDRIETPRDFKTIVYIP